MLNYKEEESDALVKSASVWIEMRQLMVEEEKERGNADQKLQAQLDAIKKTLGDLVQQPANTVNNNMLRTPPVEVKEVQKDKETFKFKVDLNVSGVMAEGACSEGCCHCFGGFFSNWCCSTKVNDKLQRRIDRLEAINAHLAQALGTVGAFPSPSQQSMQNNIDLHPSPLSSSAVSVQSLSIASAPD